MDRAKPNLDDIFGAALELASPTERAAYLGQACGEDLDARQHIERLLTAHCQAGSFLGASPSVVAATTDLPAQTLGTMIGPYKLLQQIGEGGFGTVFMAQQQHPVRRKVALKVIKAGMDTRQVIARFEAERQALAMMDHLNIARVLDVGATDSGRPFFVMELVHGVPITKYCDDNHLTPRQRLELFVPVCQAIQHAHQKSVIHRDIKPSNVLVTLYDGKPVPKVIDFGVAKAIEQRLTEQTLFTQYGTMVGTLEYMSPEQAEMSALGADTRSDIYSLGVLLYELLAGSTPLTHKRLKEAAYAEILRMIKEDEPPKPSTRLSDSGEALASISANRHTEPAKLTKLVRGELDWIVMKCLEKDRNRRYETANGLADDIERYLHDQEVLACPPTALYRFRKFARRNKRILATVGLVALVLVAGTVVSAWQAIRATEAEGLAQMRLQAETEAQNATRDQLRLTEQAQQLADDRARQIRQDLEGLKAANALLERGLAYFEWRHWDDADAALTKAIQLRPEHSSLWTARADLYIRLGLWELAASDIAKAFELQEPDQSPRWHGHALLRLCVGDRNGYRQACVRMHDRFHGTSNAELAMELVRTCLLVPDPDTDPAALVELAQAAARGPRHAWYLYTLGTAHYRAGQYEQAIDRLCASLKMGADWHAKGMNYPVLAMAYHKLGREAEAHQALDDAARTIDRWTQDRYQGASGNWVEHQGATGIWPIWWWDGLEGQLYYREALALMGLPPPPDDPRLHVLRGRALAGLRWSDKAIAEYAAALKLSPHDPQIRLEAHRNRGCCLVGLRQWDQAAAEFARASELQPDDPYLWQFRAVAHLAAGDRDAYGRVCAGMLEWFSKTQGPDVAYQVVSTCVARQDALPDPDQLLPVARVAASWYPGSIRVLAAAHYRAGHYEKAVEHLQQAARVSRFRAWDWFFLAMAQHRLGRAEEVQRCLAKAVAWIDEADRQELIDLGGTRPAWGHWSEPILVSVLRREAEGLVEGKKK